MPKRAHTMLQQIERAMYSKEDDYAWLLLSTRIKILKEQIFI